MSVKQHISTQVKASLKATGVFALAAFMAMHGTAQAGFLDSFYNSAGAAVNVTPSQVYQTQSLGIVTGGGLVWRTPNRSFSPVYFSPPSLRAGCGGIDLFLGSFGMANKQEFVQQLRNIGQNAAGLAFKVALQAMAPELESKMQEIATYINDWNKQFSNSCQAAESLMSSGPASLIKETVLRAKNNLTANGQASDYSAASSTVNTDGSAAIANAPDIRNNDGKTIEGSEVNIMWSAFNSSNLAGLSENEKFIMMGLTGTVVYKKSGSGADATLTSFSYPHINGVKDFVGNPKDSFSTIPAYVCLGTERDKCLNVSAGSYAEKSFSRMIYEKASNLRNSIINRVQPNTSDMKLLTVTTSIPIYKIIQISTLPGKSYLGDELLEIYSLAVATEVGSRYVEELSRDIEKFISNSSSQKLSKTQVDELEKFKKRIEIIKNEMKIERDVIYQQITKNGAMLQQIEHMERLLYGNLSSQLAANLRFGR